MGWGVFVMNVDQMAPAVLCSILKYDTIWTVALILSLFILNERISAQAKRTRQIE